MAIDNKTLRRSHDRANGKGPLPLLCARAAAHHLGEDERRGRAGQATETLAVRRPIARHLLRHEATA